MLLHNIIKGKSLILASNSPRRQQLLKGLDVDFEIWSTNHEDESYPNDLPVEQVPTYLAKHKASFFTERLSNDTILITCDTVVVCNGKVLGKPVDLADAVAILKQLSGNRHTVITGVCLSTANKSSCFSSFTDVYFRHLTDEEIEYYIERYKPYDKAGAYGIQEWIGYVAIERIEGSYFNVMGLPVQKLHNELLNFINNNQ
ncbi:MAG: septum formation protein Maf [Bacteroidales bacterium]|nr:MAG: septum formation protein Maf [Bacteroidales bacterium]